MPSVVAWWGTAAAAAAAVGAASASAAVAPAPRFVTMDKESGMFLEPGPAGRQLTLHGVNVCPKLAPFLPSNDSADVVDGFGARDMASLKAWGMNMVRLCVMWEGVMPQPGVVNATYLGLVHQLIDTMYDDYGIYTLVDAHQDTLNGRLCGEGIPTWALDKGLALQGFDANDTKVAFPAPFKFDLPTNPTTGMPKLSACMNNSFFDYYLTFESQAAWKALYSQTEMHDDFAAAWAAVATELKDSPGVLGYELLNEPWAGLTDHPLSDTESLLPLYGKLATAIRLVDAEHLIFFEPLATDSYLGIAGATTDFPPGGIPIGSSASGDTASAEADPHQVYTYHIYWPPQAPGTNISKAELAALKLYISLDWDGQTRSLAHTQLGGFLSEFGAVGDDSVSMELAEDMLQHAASRKQGWAYWTYKSFHDITTQNQHTETFFNEDGSLQALKVKVLGSAYPRAVAGDLVSWKFESGGAATHNGTGVLEVVLARDADTAPNRTELHVGVDGLHCNGATDLAAAHGGGAEATYGSCSLSVAPPGAVAAPGGVTLSADPAGGGGAVVARIVHAPGFAGNVSVTVTGV